MTITAVQKLTPPQLDALKAYLPGLAGTGMLSTTASIATFDRKLAEFPPTREETIGDMTVDNVTKIVGSARDRATNASDTAGARKLDAVLAKLLDPAQKHIKVTSA